MGLKPVGSKFCGIKLVGAKLARDGVLAIAIAGKPCSHRPCSHRFGSCRRAQVLTLSPINPATINATLARRTSAIDSPNKMIPAITVPTAPTPVQIA